MPCGSTGQEFWSKYYFGIFAWKLVDGIFSDPKKWSENNNGIFCGAPCM